MTTLVVGANGATGSLVVEQLLAQGQKVKGIVRSFASLPQAIRQNENLQLIEASLLAMSDAELDEQVKGCSAVVSCLGHNLSIKGVYGQPRRLVTDAVKRLTAAVVRNSAETKVKFILMSSTGVQNFTARESVSFAQSMVVGLIRHLVPPHKDNELAAHFLLQLDEHLNAKQSVIEWVVVRPDSLIDEEVTSDYELYPSPIRSAIFDAGKTSRVNVAHFISELVINQPLWRKWQGQMPVIYNN